MMTDPAAAPPADRPYPPRYRWLKRLGGAALVLAVLLVGLRLWWGYRANTRLETLVAEIEATGDPIHFEDLVIESVPDADNKAYHLRQAMNAWPVVAGQGVLITETDWYQQKGQPGAPPDPITDNAAYLQQLQPVIAHLRQMKAATRCDWGVRPTSPMISHWNTAYLSQIRREARLIEDAARRAHELGDEEATLELIELVLDTGATTNAQVPSLIEHLVRISVHAVACGVVEERAPTLEVPADRDAAARQQAEVLIARLINHADLHESQARGFVGERWVTHDTARAVMDGRLGMNQFMPGTGPGSGHQVTMGLFKPVLVNDVAFLQRYLTAVVEASREADSLPAYEAAFAARFDPQQLDVVEEYPLLHMFSAIMMPSFDAATRTHAQITATQRMAATALAIRLYEIDHGQRPDTLDALVPDYLPAVPRDPFTLDQPIGYRPQGAILIEQRHTDEGHLTGPPLQEAGPAILYSVSRNQTDHGGLMVLDAGGEIDGSAGRFNDGDQWFLLDPDPGPYTLP